MEVIKINDDTWRIEDSGVRYFLLQGSKKALLIDTGMSGQEVRKTAEELTDLPIELINTHADIDHIGGNKDFEVAYMHPAELYNYKGNIIPVWDGDIIDLGDRSIKVIHTPGHTPGSIALLDLKNKALFSGDPIQDGNIFLFGNQREINAYKHSLIRIKNMRADIDTIYPSHGSFPVSFDIIGELIKGTEAIINKEIKPTKGEIFGNIVGVYDIRVAKILGEYLIWKK